MHPQVLISKVLERIDAGATGPDLLGPQVQAADPALYQHAVGVFGSWEACLAQSLVFLRGFYERQVEQRGRDEDGDDETPDLPRPDRGFDPTRARAPLAVFTPDGFALLGALHTLKVQENLTWAPLPQGETLAPARVQVIDSDSSLLLFTTAGQYVALDARVLPEWEADALVRPLTSRFSSLATDEGAFSVLPRRITRDKHRVYTVSTQGQIKASDTSEYANASTDARPGTLLRDGDTLLSVFHGPADVRVCVVSSHGRAIVFGTDDIRSQGRKATGVRAIQLDGDARAVASWVVRDEAWMVMVTNTGGIKRVPMRGFRAQGRAGGGLQTCRLGTGEFVSRATQAELNEDVLLVTSLGRWARLPVYDIPFGRRDARCQPLDGLHPGEEVVTIAGVAPGFIQREETDDD